MQKNKLMTHTAIMTAVNLLMRAAGVGFNAYLTARIGSSGMGLFQLVMTVYSLATTFSSAGVRLATTRVAVEINALKRNDMSKSIAMCVTYAGICGCLIGFALFGFSDLISTSWISDSQTALPLRILSLSLPFVAMSSSLGGYFTAIEKIPQYSAVQLIEQIFKITVTVCILFAQPSGSTLFSCIAIVTGMTAAEIFSFTLSSFLKRKTMPQKSKKTAIEAARMLRVALPDAAGTCARSILLTIEHLLIPKGFRKSGEGSEAALAAYGNIHGLALPVLLFPSAILSSLSALLVPELAKMNEKNEEDKINYTVRENLKKSLAFSTLCAVFMTLFAPAISRLVYKTNEAVMYIRILSPLVPVMYTDMITDGMLKGLDQQVNSMTYNIIDSAICVALVYFLLPKYSVKGYIFILYSSEIINFYLSFGRLIKICDIRLFSAPRSGNSTAFHRKKYSNAPEECEFRAFRGREIRSQDL